MASRHFRQLSVEIDGNAIPNVTDVEYGLEVRPNQINMGPSDARPRLARIRITRMSDDSVLFWDWASKPFRGNFKGGKVKFYSPDEESKFISQLEWFEGFVTHYSESVPDVQMSRETPQTETIEISAQKIKINDVEIEADTWA